jgi:AcrR family transcriptional regulator
MPRIVKEEEYIIKRNEILDAAQQLVYTKGYEQMSIQDILDVLGISKGAFYHYFDSKGALLEALSERMMDEAVKVLTPVVQDPNLKAIEKLHHYIDTAGRWKIAQKTYLLALFRVWYHDDNAIVRQKVMAAATQRISPMITEIVKQGIREGVFSTPYPEQAGEIFISLFLTLGEPLAKIILSYDPVRDQQNRIEIMDRFRCIEAAYMNAMERVLSAPPGSLHLVEPEMLEEWFE